LACRAVIKARGSCKTMSLLGRPGFVNTLTDWH
jgi:hypothetical protein